MGKVIHFEIPVEDPDKSLNFYASVFGWSFNKVEGQDYWLAKTGDDNLHGINGAIMKRKHPDQPLTNNILVDDLDSTIRKIEKLGGKVVVDKMTIPNTGHLAFFKDLDGNIFGIMEHLK